jgi:hypothetical protein
MLRRQVMAAALVGADPGGGPNRKRGLGKKHLPLRRDRPKKGPLPFVFEIILVTNSCRRPPGHATTRANHARRAAGGPHIYAAPSA